MNDDNIDWKCFISPMRSSFSFSVNSMIRLKDMFSYLSVSMIESINDCGNVPFFNG